MNCFNVKKKPCIHTVLHPTFNYYPNQVKIKCLTCNSIRFKTIFSFNKSLTNGDIVYCYCGYTCYKTVKQKILNVY